MAFQVVERRFLVPTGIDHIRRTIQFPAGAELLGILDHARLGPRILYRADTANANAPIELLAVQERIDLEDPVEIAGRYIGSFYGHYRSIPQEPPAEDLLKQDVYHVFELTVP